MFFLKKRSNFEKKRHELSYRSNNIYQFIPKKLNVSHASLAAFSGKSWFKNNTICELYQFLSTLRSHITIISN